MATPRMSSSYWYTLPNPSLEGVGIVTKIAVVVASFWLALGKVGCGIPSWLMAMTTALTRA
jgi:hypothetical protein